MLDNYPLAGKGSKVNRYMNKQEDGLHAMGKGSRINKYTNKQERGLHVTGKVKLGLTIFTRNSNTLMSRKRQLCGKR